MWNSVQPQVQWGVVIGASLAAAVWDILRGRIPNVLTGPLLISGLAYAALRAGLAGVADSAVACLLLSGPFVLLFAFAGGGAGDAKLMAGIGAWLGVRNGLAALASVAVSGAVLAIGFALARAWCRRSRAATPAGAVAKDAADRLTEVRPIRRTTVPYGVAVLAGVCIAAGLRLLEGL